MATPTPKYSLVISITLCLSFLPTFHITTAQETLSKSGCTFYDEKYVYNIQLSKGANNQYCPSLDSLSAKFETTDSRVLEISYEVMQAQGLALRLTERVENLTRTVEGLGEQLRATREELGITREELQTLQAANQQCPGGYTVQIDNIDEKSCYMFVGRELNWYNAETYCMSTGGHLVAMETKDEHDFIVDYIKSNNILPGNHLWTGGNDIAQEGHWTWAGTNVPFNHSQWMVYPTEDGQGIPQPDNHRDDEHCMQIFHLQDYQWNDMYCGYNYYFICERRIL